MTEVRITTQDPDKPARLIVGSNAVAFEVKVRKAELVELDRLRKEREAKLNAAK